MTLSWRGGRGWRRTKFEVNRTNIEWVTLPAAPSVSSGDLLPDVRLTSADVRADVTTKTETKSGTFCILEFKWMSDVIDQYLIRVRFQAENQYESLWRTLGGTLQHQGWCVDQISLNEEDLRENLKFFQVPESSIEAIGSKLDMWIFDEYVNILRCMYHRHWVLDLMEVPPGPDLLPKTHRPGDPQDLHPLPRWIPRNRTPW
jgi:hypothetical protein